MWTHPLTTLTHTAIGQVEYEMQMLEKEHMETCALYQQTLFACGNEIKRLEVCPSASNPSSNFWVW